MSMASPLFCPQCGTQFSSADRFCSKCGAARPNADRQASEQTGTPATTSAPAGGTAAGGSAPSPEAGAPAYRTFQAPLAGTTGQTGQQPSGTAYPFLTALADPGKRFAGWVVTQWAPGVFAYIPILGWMVGLAAIIANLVLYARGQDLGAFVLKMRVVRSNGEVAGFFHMWTRSLASVLSLLPLLAGYWTAFSDPRKQTWHDKLLQTYVVDDLPDYANRPKTNSTGAVVWF